MVLRPNATTLRLYQLAAYVQAESISVSRLRVAAVGPIKLIKHTLKIVWEDASTEIAHGNGDFGFIGSRLDNDLFSRRRIFIGVVAQVSQHFYHAIAVRENKRQSGFEWKMERTDRHASSNLLDHLLQNGCERDGFRMQRQFARFDGGGIQHIAHETIQPIHLLV